MNFMYKIKILNNKIRFFIDQLAYLPDTFHLIWKASAKWTAIWATLLLFQAVLPVITIYLTRILVNDMVNIIHSGISWEQIQKIWKPVIAMAVVVLFTEILGSLIGWIRQAQAEIVDNCMMAMIHNQSAIVDLAFYESPEYYDNLHRARDEAGSRSLAILENGGSFLQSSITLLAMAGILIPYGPWIPPVLIVSTLPALGVVLYFDRQYHQWWKKTTVERRKAQYYDWMLTNGNNAPDVRIFGLAASFQTAYQSIRFKLRAERLLLSGKQSLGQFAAVFFAFFAAVMVMSWMGWRVINGFSKLGDLALFYQVFIRGQTLMRNLLNNLGKIYTNTLFLSDLFQFLNLKPEVADPVQPSPIPSTLKQGIHFNQVRFCYPGSQRMILDDFNVFLPAGQTTAIVGPNGAGKSTLIKLLCRFYDVKGGRLEVDGIDIRAFNIESYRHFITVLMQSPALYQDTVRHNIHYGDVSTSIDSSEIEMAARAAGAHDMIMKLANGYDSLLGKWYADGTELSSGEWQRIALARAFYRKAKIIILDEPTSFMDSWSEADWFDRFRNLAGGRTGIIITHRFTIARHADVIHVMDQGKIVESGSHDELVAKKGMYARSWIQQTQAMDRGA